MAGARTSGSNGRWGRRAALLLATLVGVASSGGPGLALEGRGRGHHRDSLERAAGRLDRDLARDALRTLSRGQAIFRYDSFGNEDFWGGALRLHEAVATVDPVTALAVGLKVDVEALPRSLVKALKRGEVDLTDPQVTVALLKLDAVVGVKGVFDAGGQFESMGIQCALCHSTVDDSFAPGIGRRLDGWANRDLNVGAIVALAPDLSPFADLLGVSEATVRQVLNSWGPGKFDASLSFDGKAFRDDGQPGAVLIPPAFGLAGVNLHTWTGWGSVSHWNALVAVLEMHGKGTFVDARLNDAARFPIAAAAGFADVRTDDDRVTGKLGALHLYQLALEAPPPPRGSYDRHAAKAGEELFSGKAGCGTCHVPPLYTEPGHNLHSPEEIGIDAFQAERSPARGYRTSPLKGLWTHAKGGFYHDGRFETLADVVDHYDAFQALGLTPAEKRQLVEFLKSI
jgi:hypothetical protein